MLQVVDVRKRLGHRQVLRGLNLSCAPSEIVSIMRALIEGRGRTARATVLASNDRAFVSSVGGTRYELRDRVLARVSSH